MVSGSGHQNFNNLVSVLKIESHGALDFRKT